MATQQVSSANGIADPLTITRELEAGVPNLETRLAARHMIGQATGLLMAHEGLTSNDAFLRLWQIAQAGRTELPETASRYVRSWNEKAQRGSEQLP